ncbi:hypothetical protein [Vulcanisaeta distributa]|uniref:hypothetical protein n=1 Tax=Vulcanisaeta distributa TaxID=164451 RepID=UPI0006D00018|nr:hypothetical protein [Vulcanisaeta distributa]
MFGLGRKRRLTGNEEIEEELVIDDEGKDEFGLAQTQSTNPPQIPPHQQNLTDLRSYIDELSRRIEEVMSIKNDLDKLTQMRPTIENYINTLNEIVKTLSEIENLLNKLEELRRRL